MRKKGAIWKSEYQKIIVNRYRQGMPVSEILQLEELEDVSPSEYVVRQILKENNVKPVWQRAKMREVYWDDEVVDFIVQQRNEGDSFSDITEKVAQTFKKIDMSRSTVVRILEENSGRLEDHRYPRGEKLKKISNLIVRKYEDGMLVKKIRLLPEVSRYNLSEHAVRDILKNEGVELTGRKGKLRRWPEELQQRVVQLFRDGLTFEEIKQHDEISVNNPTDYAIRTILRRKGVVTRKASYLQPISKIRYRRYRDRKLAEKDVSLIHKHLARFAEGRHLMLERMGLKDMEIENIECLSALQHDTLAVNVQRWEGFFHWGMQFLYDDELKKKVFELGLEYSRAVNYLKKSCRDRNEEKIKRAWKRICANVEEMREFQRVLLTDPAKRFQIETMNENEPAIN